MPNTQAIHKTTVKRASARKRFAIRFAFGEPQQQDKIQPDKYRSPEGQVIRGDMENICIQVVLLLQSLFQFTNLLIDTKLYNI